MNTTAGFPNNPDAGRLRGRCPRCHADRHVVGEPNGVWLWPYREGLVLRWACADCVREAGA